MRMHWTLRLGAALCFIGHGAFGVITKAAWLPYFAVVGIPEAWAWRLMPLVGLVDIAAGLIVLLAPRKLPLVYMVVWAAWTALLRPLAGEPFFETLERAGNYGVPLAFLLLLSGRPARVPQVLKWTTCLLLLGHGALGAITNKAMLGGHYASIGLSPALTPLIGSFEIGLALAIALGPTVPLLLFVALWKVATEALFLSAGAPIWEFVERAGSYAAPLALALIIARSGIPRDGASRVPATSASRVHGSADWLQSAHGGRSGPAASTAP